MFELDAVWVQMNDPAGRDRVLRQHVFERCAARLADMDQVRVAPVCQPGLQPFPSINGVPKGQTHGIATGIVSEANRQNKT
jgi:hypothetical protein